MNFQKSIFALLLLSFSFATQGANFECQEFFWQQKIPIVPNEKAMLARPLCFSEFAILYSGRSKTPIFAVERLNKNSLNNAARLKRTDRFYEEARLPYAQRAQLSDYRDSGYNRGHMAPAGDMTTLEGMAQSFSLANMVPQKPKNNRKMWASIEKATRKYVKRAQGDVYVITGPVYGSSPKKIGGNSVWVPDFLFKLVIDPATNKAWAHWIANSDRAKVGPPISYSELVSRTGIEFLPGFNPDLK